MKCTYSILAVFTIPIDGLSLLNEDGGLTVNSIVTNSTLTLTKTPWNGGNDHIVCYGMGIFSTTVTWHKSSGERLERCGGHNFQSCGYRYQCNGGVGVDPALLNHTHIHIMYILSQVHM